ncbi:MAG TPA: hypothetical protein VEI02_00545, partial [Planctomycetota bacterium]|nr:hypothetical protein [Planctomycetota bacterium]
MTAPSTDAPAPRLSDRVAAWRRAVSPEERALALRAFLLFFLLLGGYYALRPVRDAVGSEGGPRAMAENFTGTFLVATLLTPLYGALVVRTQRPRFLAVAYRFFAVVLLLWAAAFAWRTAAPDAFAAAMRGAPLATLGGERLFNGGWFVWVSVYNVFLTTIFWSAAAEWFSPRHGKRWFGFIAAGGTCGGIAGPWLTRWFAQHASTKAYAATWSLIVAAVALELAVQVARRMPRLAAAARPAEPARAFEAPPQGSAIDGAATVARSRFLRLIAAYLAIATLTGTFLYNARSELARDAYPDRAARTAAFAGFESWSSALTLLFQAGLTPLLLRRLGPGLSLAALPAVQMIGCFTLATTPAFAVVAWFDVFSRATRHGLATPARETLFTGVSREEKYKAKQFIDV